jgi:hypothetical protein
MTASTHMIQFTAHQDRRELEQLNAMRRRNIIAVICVAAFIAWCAMPAVVWLAQIGVSAASGNPAAEPQQLPTCVAPPSEDSLIRLERKA